MPPDYSAGVAVADARFVAGACDRDAFAHVVPRRGNPPSLAYVLITLGPAMLVLAHTEKARGRLVGLLTMFGRVPLFNVAHIWLAHFAAGIVALVMGFGSGVLANLGAAATGGSRTCECLAARVASTMHTCRRRCPIPTSAYDARKTRCSV